MCLLPKTAGYNCHDFLQSTAANVCMLSFPAWGTVLPKARWASLVPQPVTHSAPLSFSHSLFLPLHTLSYPKSMFMTSSITAQRLYVVNVPYTMGTRYWLIGFVVTRLTQEFPRKKLCLRNGVVPRFLTNPFMVLFHFVKWFPMITKQQYTHCSKHN